MSSAHTELSKNNPSNLVMSLCRVPHYLCMVHVSVSAVRSVKLPGNSPLVPVSHDVPWYQPSGLSFISSSSTMMKSPSSSSSSSAACGKCGKRTLRTYKKWLEINPNSRSSAFSLALNSSVGHYLSIDGHALV